MVSQQTQWHNDWNYIANPNSRLGSVWNYMIYSFAQKVYSVQGTSWLYLLSIQTYIW